MVLSAPQREFCDIASFGRVCTWDPDRKTGCRANRVQEFAAEDLFLETEVLPTAEGTYIVPRSSDGRGCIGLQWLERRRITDVVLEFSDPISMPSPQDVVVEAWVGESLWQGEWKPLHPTLEQIDTQWRFFIQPQSLSEVGGGIRKIRFIFPPGGTLEIRRLSAFTDSRFSSVDMVLYAESPSSGQQGEVEIYNGEIVEPANSLHHCVWDTSQTLKLRVRHAEPDQWKADRTVLRIRLPNCAFGIAVDDVIRERYVYVESFGIFATTDLSENAFARYKERIKGKKTLLDRVKELPDQTFDQAMARTHNPVQNNGPTMLSLACDNSKFVVEQNGIVYSIPPGDGQDRVKHAVRIIPRFGGVPLGHGSRRLEGGWLPVPVSVWEREGLLYSERVFVVPYGRSQQDNPWLNDKPLCVVEFTVENPTSSQLQASLKLEFLQGSDQGAPLVLREVSGRVIGEIEGKLLAVVDASAGGSLKMSTEKNIFSLSGSMDPGKKVRCYVYLPAWHMEPEKHEELKGGDRLLKAVRDYWQSVLATAAQIEIPDKKLLNVIRASQVHCLIAARNEENGARIAPWIASAAYGPLESEANSIIRGMDMLGHHEFARRALKFFIKRYSGEGYLTTGYTLMGTGWHLWTLGEHYALTKDGDWLAGVASEVARVCKWISAQRAKTKKLDAKGERVPEYGLMPPGVLADWNAFAYYFSLNGYYYAGLKHAAEALADIGYSEASDLLTEVSEFRESILRAYRWTQSRAPVYKLRDGTWVPAYPSQLYCPGPTAYFFPGEDANRSWCYDVELGAHQLVAQGVLDADSAEVLQMMKHMEDFQFLADGWFDYPSSKNLRDWFNLGGFSKVQPYYCRNAEIYAMRNEVKPFIRSYFNALASLLNEENLTLWEHFHNTGAWNKTHETGYFLQQTRFMLVMEHGAELWLAPLVTNNWLKEGMVIEVKYIPSRFGKVSYRIESHVDSGFIEASIEPLSHPQLEKMVLRLRHPYGRKIKRVLVDGLETKDFDPVNEVVYLKPNRGLITVRAEY
jgi:hypothetical protein